MIRIGTRKSQLALLQTQIAVEKIKQVAPEIEIEIVPMTTKGDQLLNRSLASFGGKGVFTKELEVDLLSGKIDLAVHSAKDLPLVLPKGLTIGAVLEREDPSDILVTMNGTKAKDLPIGSVIGTSSLRRELQIKQINPELKIKMLRGNVQTRLDKLKSGEYDGIILAAAGLKRLGILPYPNSEYSMETLLFEQFLPAPAQGILAIECREKDLQEKNEIAQIMKVIHHEEAYQMLQAERNYLAGIGGGCNAPAAAWCRKENGKWKISAMYAQDGIKMQYYTLEGSKNPEQLGQQAAKKLKVGKVYLVGAGAGNEELLTKRAEQLVKQADVIVYDSLIATSILQNTKENSKWIYAGKRASNHHLKQEEIIKILIEEAKKGQMVVRLKGGDPFIFGRGAEEAIALVEAKIPFEIVSGVSSCYSVPAYAGIPVTDRKSASSFHVITGHEQAGGSRINYEILAKEEGTLIFLMGVHQMGEICRQLMQFGKDPMTPVAVISEGTTNRQKTLVATLKTLEEKAKETRIKTPAIIVVGEVVKWTESLQWFYGNRYFSKRVLLTGTPMWTELGKEKLKELGAMPVLFSLIRTECSGKEQLQQLLLTGDYKKFKWFVFTSRNGVRYFFENWKECGMDLRNLYGIKFAVIGRGTAKTLKEYGIIADFVPKVFTSTAMAEEWIPTLEKEESVLLLRAKEGSKALPTALRERNIPYLDLDLYQIVPEYKKTEELKRILSDIDYVVLASGSAARVFAEMTEKEKFGNYKVLSIGPETTKVAENAGISVYQTAKTYSIDGILDLLRSEI